MVMVNPLLTLRRQLISRPVFHWLKGRLPRVSDTEREALEAGTVGWDAELFSGKPDWSKLLDLSRPTLTAEEQAFLDGPVEELCQMLDDWTITFRDRNLPPEVWDFIKKNRFFGMIIPREYGGLEFSALAHSSVVKKISTRSITAAVTVMVPNSLGPAELLLHYGTEEQKDHYLPRLARGEEVPCFALTGPDAGSDAASLADRGVVCWGEWEGQRVLGMRVTWEKRYITLGPVASVMGLAFRLYDPEHLLGDKEDFGITVALVPTKTPGVVIGRRHFPANQGFQNGPNSGKDVFLPLDWIIGGQERAGQGWRMLMESLSVGRSISLPSLSTGAAKLAARATGAYARVRHQFGLPIGRFEGVEEALAPIAANAYLLEAARTNTAWVVDQGEKPTVLSAILKYHATTTMRETMNHALDIHGGKAICNGPSNYLANGYYAIPVSITVEGANILTRSLIIFGQGAIRCHPWLQKEMAAAAMDDPKQAVAAFDSAFFGHLGFLAANMLRAPFHNLTGALFASAPKEAGPAHWYRKLSAASASLALVSDFALAILGGELKRREILSGRLGDVLSQLYLASCVLKRFRDDHEPSAARPLVDYCLARALYQMEKSLDAVLRNFPSRIIGLMLRPLVFPWGRHRRPPSDQLTQTCARLLLSPSDTRDQLTDGIFIGTEADPIGQLEAAFTAVIAADDATRRLKEAGVTDLEVAREQGLITDDEVAQLTRARELTRAVIMVDDFAPDELSGTATAATRGVA
jgi:acyl-CoA dehydrogenase